MFSLWLSFGISMQTWSVESPFSLCYLISLSIRINMQAWPTGFHPKIVQYWTEPACRQMRIIGDVSNKWTSTRDALDDETLDKFLVLDDAIDRLARTVEKQVRPRSRSCDY
jgi:hypothetical protein